MGQSEDQITTKLLSVLLTGAVLFEFGSSFGLELVLEEKGATFFLLRKVPYIIHIALIYREIILHKFGFTALPGSAWAVELLQFHF